MHAGLQHELAGAPAGKAALAGALRRLELRPIGRCEWDFCHVRERMSEMSNAEKSWSVYRRRILFWNPSKPGTRLFQELDFFVCGRSAQDAISMRIAAELLYDELVLDLELKIALDAVLTV